MPHFQTLVTWRYIFECYQIPQEVNDSKKTFFRLQLKVIDFCVQRNTENSKKPSELISFIFIAKEVDAGDGDVICPLGTQLIYIHIVVCIAS